MIPSNNLPDLAVRKFAANRSTVFPGQDVYFNTEVTNLGQAAVDSVELSFGWGRRDRETFTLEGLEPGQTHNFQIGPVSGSLPGGYVYRLMLDPENKTRESREDNNSAKASFSVIDTRPPGPPMPPRPPRASA